MITRNYTHIYANNFFIVPKSFSKYFFLSQIHLNDFLMYCFIFLQLLSHYNSEFGNEKRAKCKKRHWARLREAFTVMPRVHGAREIPVSAGFTASAEQSVDWTESAYYRDGFIWPR